VVLSLVMKDRGLLPAPELLMERAGMRPDVFVISNGSEEADFQVRSTVASFRKAGLHARHTYKTTKNVGKLLKEAADQRAKFALIIEGADACTVKNLESGQQQSLTMSEALAAMANKTRV